MWSIMAEIMRPVLPPRRYRYRSLTRSPNAVEEEIDSILNNYLYCSPFTRMNDPMEGYHRSSSMLKGQTDYKKIVRKIRDDKSNIGIACFTETQENVLMWAHYASNYTGMCLSYSASELVAGLARHVCLVRLAYTDETPIIDYSHTKSAGTAAKRVLSQKKFWSVLRARVAGVRISGKTEYWL
jgi:hypothetical protein